jgi:hypothetical protein
MVKGFFYLAVFLFIKMKFSQHYIADIFGVVCNSRLPQAKGTKGYWYKRVNKKKTKFKNLCTIRDLPVCIHQGLPNNTTFRPI